MNSFLLKNSRRQRAHWNAATSYPHLEAHLLDLLEEWTPLPTDLCLLVLSFLGHGLRSCLPLPRGCALLEASKKRGRRGRIELREGSEEASWELPFRGGGYIQMQGPFFKVAQHAIEAPSWHVLNSIVSFSDRPAALQLKYYDASMIESAFDESSSDEESRRPRKRRRIQQQPERRLVHQQTFAYYQVIPCGVNLFSDPGDPRTLGLVSGLFLLFAHRQSQDRDEGSMLYSLEAARKTPLTGADVRAFFRPLGMCEWNGGRCDRHTSEGCANGCCSAVHCRATSLACYQLCNEHTL